MSNHLTKEALKDQAKCYRGTGGASADNQSLGFVPAFLDRTTGTVHPSRFADGSPAPVHVLDGLPDKLVTARTPSGSVSAVRDSVTPGFVRQGRFYTRDEAAEIVSGSSDEPTGPLIPASAPHV
jgi:hypothetical protein